MAFITEIAKYINDKYDLSKESLTIIFPNKRAAMMLRLELKSGHYNNNIWLPQILSIQEAMSSWSRLQLLDNIDIVFELIRIMNGSGKHLSNDIYGLASQMLKDFDEIDQYAVNARDLFHLTKAAKEIDSWTPNKDSAIESGYVSFFSSLIDYYNALRTSLLENNTAYYGLITRTMSELSDDKLYDAVGNNKIVFAGFNAMTKTEENIIVRLVNGGKADLLWDLDEYYFNDEKQEAGAFAREFFRKNPSFKPMFLNKRLLEESKTINIIGTSGSVIQTNALQLELYKESEKHDNEVVVLSDESLLIPVLNSIPESIKELQVTMGFPYSKTALNQFIQYLFSFQKNIKSKDNSIYFWSLTRLLRTELVKLIFTDNELKYLLNWQNKCIRKSVYYITVDDYDIFKDLPDVYDFLLLISSKWSTTRECLDSLKLLLKNIYKKIKDKDKTYFLSNQISVAGRVVNKIDKLFLKHDEIIQIADIETLYKQSSAEIRINLKGSHGGLQIMGLLETRNLDFKTVHILSVNEGILPQSKGANSLIPYDIRKYYELPVYSNKQAVYAYHFYRLLQNAENVNIYYNTLADGMGEGEPSRFIRQIIYEMRKKNRNVVIVEKNYKSPTRNINKTYELEASKKNPDVYDKIVKKLSNVENGKISGLSPTSISCYLACPLKFYLQYIEKRDDNTPNELIQSNVMGTIIHATLENLYKYFGNEEVDFDKFQYIYNQYYKDAYNKALSDNNFPDGLPRTGFNYLNSKVVDKLLDNFIKYESSLLNDKKDSQNDRNNLLKYYKSFKIIGLEQELSHTFDVTVNNQKISVNLIGHADRIDKIGNVVRIIDYKTGSIKDTDVIIKKNASGLDKLTDKSLQLMIYKYLYKVNNPLVALENIEPGIFGLRRISKGLFSLSNSSETYNDANFEENCRLQFIELFAEILNKDIPFRQTSDEENCKYCDFKEVCKRNANTY